MAVPDGFSISTETFKRVIGETPSFNDCLISYRFLRWKTGNKICELRREIRRLIERVAIPDDIHEELAHHLSRLGEETAYAVRSSATAEDLRTASFAV
jgi:pyruvate,water dikinase